MTTETRFYVEKSADEYGNIGHWPYQVIEAVPEPYATEYGPGRERLAVVAPDAFRDKWSHLVRDALGGWQETEGPVRLLTREEWAVLTGYEETR